MGVGGYGISSALRVESDWATIRATSPLTNASQPLPAPPAMESVVNITLGLISRLLSVLVLRESQLNFFTGRDEVLDEFTSKG